MAESTPERPDADSSYDLYTRGIELLESGDYAAAAVPLRKVAEREPEKSSVREALGRALFRTRRFGEAAREFEAVVRAVSDERLRPLLPRPLPRPER